jgi:uncharacterized protein YecE (DUF72 family)
MTEPCRAVSLTVAIARYFLGCPMWAEPSWRGGLWLRHVPANQSLAHYARLFNTVEGNTTFYSVPSPESVARWAEQTTTDFRFCFKLPRKVTHQARLVGADEEAERFLARLDPLGARLGPFMLQLPPSFGPSRLSDLDRFVNRLAVGRQVAVELRHRGFHDDPEARREAEAVLRAAGCERIVLDTRALRAGDPNHPAVAGARHTKPDLPVRPEPLTGNPLYRWVGHPEPAVNEPWLEDLARLAVEWMRGGLRPFLMVHCPDTARTPWLARRVHELVSTHAAGYNVDVGTLPPFPAERETLERSQMRLF